VDALVVSLFAFVPWGEVAKQTALPAIAYLLPMAGKMIKDVLQSNGVGQERHTMTALEALYKKEAGTFVVCDMKVMLTQKVHEKIDERKEKLLQEQKKEPEAGSVLALEKMINHLKKQIKDLEGDLETIKAMKPTKGFCHLKFPDRLFQTEDERKFIKDAIESGKLERREPIKTLTLQFAAEGGHNKLVFDFLKSTTIAAKHLQEFGEDPTNKTLDISYAALVPVVMRNQWGQSHFVCEHEEKSVPGNSHYDLCLNEFKHLAQDHASNAERRAKVGYYRRSVLEALTAPASTLAAYAKDRWDVWSTSVAEISGKFDMDDPEAWEKVTTVIQKSDGTEESHRYRKKGWIRAERDGEKTLGEQAELEIQYSAKMLGDACNRYSTVGENCRKLGEVVMFPKTSKQKTVQCCQRNWDRAGFGCRANTDLEEDFHLVYDSASGSFMEGAPIRQEDGKFMHSSPEAEEVAKRKQMRFDERKACLDNFIDPTAHKHTVDHKGFKGALKKFAAPVGGTLIDARLKFGRWLSSISGYTLMGTGVAVVSMLLNASSGLNASIGGLIGALSVVTTKLVEWGPQIFAWFLQANLHHEEKGGTGRGELQAMKDLIAAGVNPIVKLLKGLFEAGKNIVQCISSKRVQSEAKAQGELAAGSPQTDPCREIFNLTSFVQNFSTVIRLFVSYNAASTVTHVLTTISTMLVGWVSTAVPAIAFIVFAADSLPVVFNGMNRALNPAAKQAWEERHWFVQAFRDAQVEAAVKADKEEAAKKEAEKKSIDEKTLENAEDLTEVMKEKAAEAKQESEAEKKLANELKTVADEEEGHDPTL
jgi:hypothetical protein